MVSSLGGAEASMRVSFKVVYTMDVDGLSLANMNTMKVILRMAYLVVLASTLTQQVKDMKGITLQERCRVMENLRGRMAITMKDFSKTIILIEALRRQRVDSNLNSFMIKTVLCCLRRRKLTDLLPSFFAELHYAEVHKYLGIFSLKK
jgi:hypothetical protein